MTTVLRLHEGDRGYRQTPHIAQWPLHYRLVGQVRAAVDDVRSRGDHPHVLEIGAGHGSFADTLLSVGCRVTAVDMTARGTRYLQRDYAGQDALTAVTDRELTLRAAGTDYSLVLLVSVLHHVPDYLDLLRRVSDRVRPGGALLSLSDPLWYPRVGRRTRAVDRGLYLLWRIGQGEVRDGMRAMSRRIRRRYPDSGGGDAVPYYHVVRDGVDEQAVCRNLRESFTDVDVLSYWSHHLGPVSPLAERRGLVNTFAVHARGRR